MLLRVALTSAVTWCLSLKRNSPTYAVSANVVTVANGTDAIALALQSLGIGPGDEVITAPNSFIASAGAINEVGATCRFADVDQNLNINPAAVKRQITGKTRRYWQFILLAGQLLWIF